MKIDTLDDVLELFGQIGGRGNENCVIFAQKDEAHIGERGTIIKPAIGGAVNRLTGGITGLVDEIIAGSTEAIEEFRKELNLDELNNYMQFLINETEDTISIIPIHFKGVLHFKVDEVQVFLESGRVIPKSVIKKIEIKKFGLITPTIRGVKFNLIDGYKLEFMVATNFKTLPYHIENFKKFSEKYKK